MLRDVGLGIWGVVNLMEGYGNDKPDAKSQGIVDRKLLKNPNGLILGTPGSGRSFAARREIANQEYAEPLQKKKDAYAEYRSIKEENNELQMAKHNLERFLKQQDEEQKAKEKQHNKNGQSL